MNGLFEEIQAEVETALEAHPYLSGLNVISEDKGAIESLVQTAITRAGLSVLVVMPDATCHAADTVPALLDPITVVVEVAENPVMNRGTGGTGKACGIVTECIIQALHLHTAASGRIYALSRAGSCVRMVNPPPGASVARHIIFETGGHVAASLIQEPEEPEGEL